MLDLTPEKVSDLIPIAQKLLDKIHTLSGGFTDRDVSALAEGFCRLDDDHQSKFFVFVARIMGQWDNGVGLKRDSQAYYIGKHLQTCKCSTPEAREFLESIVYIMKDQEKINA